MLENEKITIHFEIDLDFYRAKKSPAFTRYCKNIFEDEKNKICYKSIKWKYTIENQSENKIKFIYNGLYEDYNDFLMNLENASITFTAICSGFIKKGSIQLFLPNIKNKENKQIFETILTMDSAGVIYNKNNKMFD